MRRRWSEDRASRSGHHFFLLQRIGRPTLSFGQQRPWPRVAQALNTLSFGRLSILSRSGVGAQSGMPSGTASPLIAPENTTSLETQVDAPPASLNTLEHHTSPAGGEPVHTANMSIEPVPAVHVDVEAPPAVASSM